jgi:hypothetical protein
VTNPEERINRRAFLRAGIKGAGIVGVGGVLGAMAGGYLTGEAPPEQRRRGQRTRIDLEKYTSVDPGLIQYRESFRRSLALDSPRGIAVDGHDRILVAGDRRIQILDKDGAILNQIELPESPRCLTADEEGTLYVGFRDRVATYAGGKQEAVWLGLGPTAVLTSIAVKGDDVFVANAGGRDVLRFSKTGDLVGRFGKRDPARNVPGFVVPSPYFDLAIAPDGLLKVSNPGRHRMEAYTLDGDFELSWGEPSMGIEGFCGCCNPVNFTLLSDGRFVTSEKGLARLKIYEADGTFSGVVAGPSAFVANQSACCSAAEVSGPPDDTSICQSGGIDVAVDSAGRVLALDPVDGSIRVFTPLPAVGS